MVNSRNLRKWKRAEAIRPFFVLVLVRGRLVRCFQCATTVPVVLPSSFSVRERHRLLRKRAGRPRTVYGRLVRTRFTC